MNVELEMGDGVWDRGTGKNLGDLLPIKRLLRNTTSQLKISYVKGKEPTVLKIMGELLDVALA